MQTDVAYTFEKIYESESDAIFRFCFLRVSNREQALDIMQETFMRLWVYMRDDKDIQNTRALLFTIARHLIIDWYRKKKSVSWSDIFHEDEEEIWDGKELDNRQNIDIKAEARYLLSKISTLSPSYQQAVYLRFVEDLSPEEIGRILGVSANAASVRINRGLQELRGKTGYDTLEDK